MLLTVLTFQKSSVEAIEPSFQFGRYIIAVIVRLKQVWTVSKHLFTSDHPDSTYPYKKSPNTKSTFCVFARQIQTKRRSCVLNELEVLSTLHKKNEVHRQDTTRAM